MYTLLTMQPLVILGLTSLFSAFCGSYLGGYLKKKGENLATHEDVQRLVEQVSRVTEATKQIEARINRSSRVYERQLVVLQKLYRDMVDAQALFMRMTSAGRMSGEITPVEYVPEVEKAMKEVREDYLNGKLLMPLELVKKCEMFFDVVFEGQRNFAVAHIPNLGSDYSAEYWKKAAEIAHQQVPQILQEIEKAARAIIHGEAS